MCNLCCGCAAPQPGTGLRRNLVKSAPPETPEPESSQPKAPEVKTSEPKAPVLEAPQPKASEPITSQPMAPEVTTSELKTPESKDLIKTTSNTTDASDTTDTNTTDANTTDTNTNTTTLDPVLPNPVTGYLFKTMMWEGNTFDPTVATVPSGGYGNTDRYINVPVIDDWVEFATDFGSGAIEKLDISTTGLITLDVNYPANTTYIEGEYILESPWFKLQYRAAKLVSSNGVPADVLAPVIDASNLAAGVLKIHIFTFNVLEGTINFQLQYQLVSGCATVVVSSKSHGKAPSRLVIPATFLSLTFL